MFGVVRDPLAPRSSPLVGCEESRSGYAIDPAPSGPPWRQWDESGPHEAAEQGCFAPFGVLSDGPARTILPAPGDTRGTRLILERAGGYYMGIDGKRRPEPRPPGLRSSGRDADRRLRVPAGRPARSAGGGTAARPARAAGHGLGGAAGHVHGRGIRRPDRAPSRPATGALRHRLSAYRDIPAGMALAQVVWAVRGATRGREPYGGRAAGRCRSPWMPRSGPNSPCHSTAPGCPCSAVCRRAWNGTTRCRRTRRTRSARPGRRSGTRSRGRPPSGNRGRGRSTTGDADPPGISPCRPMPVHA